MKRIVIMGASSGLGKQLARIYATQGWLVGAAARSQQNLDSLKAEFPDNVKTAVIDINSTDAPRALNTFIDTLGGIDLYLHVAGIGYDNPSLDVNRECGIVETDCLGFARMISTAFDIFAHRGQGGHIAAITSVAGTKGIAMMEAYSASKRFGCTYLQGLRQRSVAQKLGITITDIRPGWTRTPLLRDNRSYPLLMDSQRVASSIVNAIAKRKNVATIDYRWRALCFAWSLLPDFVWRHISPKRFVP